MLIVGLSFLYEETCHAHRGHAQAGHAQAGHAQAEHAQAGHAQGGHAQAGHTQVDHVHSCHGFYINHIKHVPEFSSGTNVTNMLSSDRK